MSNMELIVECYVPLLPVGAAGATEQRHEQPYDRQ
jgi:hypothetical protein